MFPGSRKAPIWTGLCSFCSVLALAACSHSPAGVKPGDTLADLKSTTLADIENESAATSIGSISTLDVAQHYRALLANLEKSLEDRQSLLKIDKRIADLELQLGEDAIVDGQDTQSYLQDAITRYKKLIASTRGDDVARLLYQLAKAQAMAGLVPDSLITLNQLADQYPDSSYRIEAEFRLAEVAFNAGNYPVAKQKYQFITSLPTSLSGPSAFHQNALYMQGWSDFKMSQYDSATTSFIGVLDSLLIPAQARPALNTDENADPRLFHNALSDPDHSNNSDGLSRYTADLGPAAVNLAQDSLRILSIAFAYMGGAQAIDDAQQRLGNRAYIALLYQHLGDLYLSQQRHRDAAQTFEAYVQANPYALDAPEFSVRTINTYYQGHFPTQIQPAKARFVDQYGIDSDYWLRHQPNDPDNQATHPYLTAHLHRFLLELSSDHHANAQNQQAPLTRDERLDEFRQAARRYDQFVRTFPSDPKAPESAFLMGEALFEAGEFASAADAYQLAAYELDQQSSPEIRTEAGYNLILAMDALINESLKNTAETDEIKKPSPTEIAIWEALKLSALQAFADHFPEDSRAAPALVQAASLLFAAKDLQAAIDVSKRVTEWPTQPEQAVLQSAWQIMGQGYFDLNQFLLAEQSYRTLISLLPAEDHRQTEFKNRIAACLYRRAELIFASTSDSVSNSNLDTVAASPEQIQALELWLSIAEIAPQSDIAATAHFDAINRLLDWQDWSRAERQLNRFIALYPTHSLASGIPAKQAQVYQELEDWGQAALALNRMIDLEQDEETKRVSTYLSAELFLKASDDDQAKRQFERYVNRYPQPRNRQMEAYFELARLENERLPASENPWLAQLIKLSDANSPDRQRYLGAWARNQIAFEHYDLFRQSPLTLPLRKTLKQKRARLQRAIASYNEVLQMGVAEFTTQATFYMGSVYAQLSQDLLNSERPDNLSALELDQYNILLEEQAFPFEEQAIDLHEVNIQRSWSGLYDIWVQRSFESLATLLPGRYNKLEQTRVVSHGIY